MNNKRKGTLSANLTTLTYGKNNLGIHSKRLLNNIPFNPMDYGLPINFRLSNYSNRLSCAAVNPTYMDIQSLLSNISKYQKSGSSENKATENYPPIIFPQEVTITKANGTDFLIFEFTNFLSPIIDEPYYLGWIGFAIVMSGLYAIGLTGCTTHRMILLGVNNLDKPAQNVVVPMMIQGYTDAAKMDETIVHSIKIIDGPSIFIGGTTIVTMGEQHYMKYNFTVPGDAIILTKPLGTSIALKLIQMFENPDGQNADSMKNFTVEDIQIAKQRVIQTMMASNRFAAHLMKQFMVRAVCEISMYGLRSHAQTLLNQQINPVNFHIYNLPVITKMYEASVMIGSALPFIHGMLPEISGGLLICLPQEYAAAFVEQLKIKYYQQSWVIGAVEGGKREVIIKTPPRVLEIPPEYYYNAKK